MMALLDDLRARLGWVFGADSNAFSFAVSGTGTSGMEIAIANVTRPGARALVVVNGYFGDRLAQILERYGAEVSRLDVEWGRACDPDQVARALKAKGADIVAMVHGETSTGVVNPVREIVALAQAARRDQHCRCGHAVGGVPCRRGAGARCLLQLHPESALARRRGSRR